MNAVQTPQIVYVEDDVMSREIVRVLLVNVLGIPGLTVFESSENLIGRLGALEVTPNIFFLDVQIGPYDGYEMLNMLRAEQAYQAATIIAMTANVMSYDVEQLKAAGFDGLIGKPIRKAVFPELMERLLAGEPVWYVP